MCGCNPKHAGKCKSRVLYGIKTEQQKKDITKKVEEKYQK